MNECRNCHDACTCRQYRTDEMRKGLESIVEAIRQFGVVDSVRLITLIRDTAKNSLGEKHV